MRKVIGIGETILDIIFRNDQPTKAVPGGSVFNAMVSLARSGVQTEFVSQIGDDHVGDIIVNFMQQNGMSTCYMARRNGIKTDASLAFLNEQNDAQYVFYKDYQGQQPAMELPEINADDLVLIGSFYSLNPLTRSSVVALLEEARRKGAIIYYDPNFRANHSKEIIRLMPTIIENLEFADIVRGSNEDFGFMFGLSDADKIYNEKIKFYTPNFLCTLAADGVALRTSHFGHNYAVPAIETVSTIGAGDNFNAGILCGLIREGVTRAELDNLPREMWDKIVETAIGFSSEVCQSYDNYISWRE